MPFSIDAMTRFVIGFTYCFLIFACSSEEVPQTESLVPVVASPATPQEISLPKFECENTTGIIGTTDINFDANTVLYFYDTPDSSQTPAQTLRFYEDTALLMYSFRAEGEKSYFELNPQRHKLDYSLFKLAVKSRRNGWFVNWLEVVVGEQKNETLWVKEGVAVRFKDWLQDMKTSFSVGSKDSKSNPLRVEPNVNAKEITFAGNDCFKVKDMKGDWILVEQQNRCSGAPEQSITGWLRWRDENGCLLIEIFPFA